MNTIDLQGWLSTFTGKILEWLVSTGLSIAAILVAAAVAARVSRVAIAWLEALLVRQAAKQETAANAEENHQRIHTLCELLSKTSGVVVWVIAGMTLLKAIGIDIGPLLAGAGIAGLAVGFGAQNLVRDVVSGFFILLENQVAVGDVAIINGTGGLVESINFRTIVLRDLAGVVHVFPNGTITTLANMTKDWSAMVFEIGVAYKEDTDRVVEVMKAVAADLQADPEFSGMMLEPLEVLGVESFGDSAVVIKARQKTKPVMQWTVGREYRRRLKRAFDRERIEIPFPHRTVYWGEASEAFRVLVNDHVRSQGGGA